MSAVMAHSNPFPSHGTDEREKCFACHIKTDDEFLEMHERSGCKLCPDCLKEWIEADENERLAEELFEMEKNLIDFN